MRCLAKILCHNLVCLVHSAYELGVQATFWKDEEVVDAAQPPPTSKDDEMMALGWM